MIKYVSRESIAPSLGKAYPKQGIILIRDDLSRIAKRFLIAHETYHLTDKATSWLWREIKANAYGFRKCPTGGIECLIITVFSMDRLKFYWKKIRGM